MNNEMRNALQATEQKAQYDACAKRLLGQKIILAHILVKTVQEFQEMDPKDVISYIEGEPYISTVPVEPGLTNRSAERIVGFNSEDKEIQEGMAIFDIVFYVRMKDGLSQIIINVEAQKDEPSGYEILNRAIFYVSRLISSQKSRDFQGSNYNDIKQVYSIWICMNLSENSLSHIQMVKRDILGSYPWKGNLDLMNIVMIGVAKDLPEHDERYELHRLLGTLLSEKLTAKERFDIIGNEYDISVKEDLRKDVSDMCNLSQGIEERGIEKGIERGISQSILTMHKKGKTAEEIADLLDKDIEEVRTIIEQA